MSKRIIHSLRERRLVEDAVAGLAAATSEGELTLEVQRIASEHAPELVLPAIRKNLGTGSSRMRGGLGRLSALLAGPETVAMLRTEAGRRDNPTQTRLNAAMILEKFLQVEVSAGLMGDLNDPNFIVFQSLEEAVEEARSNRAVLMEYVRQMSQENLDVAHLVIDLIGRLPEKDQPELLRLIAYDSRPGVGEAAVDRLSSLRGEAVGAQSASKLHTLQSTLRPELAQTAARNLRKLRLAGVHWNAQSADDWWGLISPSDLQGTQHLWFLGSENEVDGKVVGQRINRVAGILGAFGHESLDRRHLPPSRRTGELYSIPTSPGESADFIAIPYEYARHVLHEGLESHWGVQSKRALPDEFTLFCPLLFQCEADPISDELSSLLASGPELWEEEQEELSKVTAALLEHSAMAGWILPIVETGGDTEALLRQLPRREVNRTGRNNLAGLPLELLGKLADMVVSEIIPQKLVEQLRQALLAQAAWLHYAGDQGFARRSVYLSESLRRVPLHNHPLLLQMIARGFVALSEEENAREQLK